MATKSQVRNKALKKIRVLEEGETPTNEVIADVESTYDDLHAYLGTENATTWDIDEEIPDEATRYVVTMLAFDIADDFGVDEIRYGRLKAERDLALAQLIELASSNYVSRTVAADYF